MIMYIKEKRFANFEFEVFIKGQDVSEENIVPLLFLIWLILDI